MQFTDDIEKTIQKQELSFRELTLRAESLNKEVETLLEELNVTASKLTLFLEDKENFTEENWQTILKERQDFDDKLKRELANIRNPLKNKKTYSNLVVNQHWLYVR